jgi:hypothetical protein
MTRGSSSGQRVELDGSITYVGRTHTFISSQIHHPSFNTQLEKSFMYPGAREVHLEFQSFVPLCHGYFVTRFAESEAKVPVYGLTDHHKSGTTCGINPKLSRIKLSVVAKTMTLLKTFGWERRLERKSEDHVAWT